MMTPLETIAALMGLINLVLIVRRSVRAYPFGVVMVCLYFKVFIDARLYGAAGLQLFFLGAQLYGWWSWSRVGPASEAVPIALLGARGRALAIAAGCLGTLLFGLAMNRWTDAGEPWWDAGNAAWSMVAQVLTLRRHFDAWVLWIAIDILSVGLYASQGLLVTAGLYAIFLAIASWGLVQWYRASRLA